MHCLAQPFLLIIIVDNIFLSFDSQREKKFLRIERKREKEKIVWVASKINEGAGTIHTVREKVTVIIVGPLKIATSGRGGELTKEIDERIKSKTT